MRTTQPPSERGIENPALMWRTEEEKGHFACQVDALQFFARFLAAAMWAAIGLVGISRMAVTALLVDAHYHVDSLQ